MKKLFIVMLGLLCALIGYIVGARSWTLVTEQFQPIVISPEKPTDLAPFRLASAPPYSADHYYFRSGFTDVSTYWSFILPPDEARKFLDSYMEEQGLRAVEDAALIPPFASGKPSNPAWQSEYWFSSPRKLSEIYMVGTLLCGYSTEADRIYMANWAE